MTGKQRKINQNSKLLVYAKSQRKQICNAKIFWFTYFHSFLSLFYRVSHSLVSGLRNRLFSYCPGDPRHLRFYPYPRRRESPTISSISDHDVNVKVALLSSTTVRPWIDVRPKIEPGSPSFKDNCGDQPRTQVLWSRFDVAWRARGRTRVGGGGGKPRYYMCCPRGDHDTTHVKTHKL